MDTQKQLKDWSTRDFLFYFQNKFVEKYHVIYRLTTPDWPIYGGAIKKFFSRNSLTKEQYKEFIDVMFSDICNNDYVPVVGFIVSDKVFRQYLVWKSSRGGNLSVCEPKKFEQEKLKLKSQTSEKSDRDLDQLIEKYDTPL